MNAKESMERFYAGENEEARLLSRHGQVEYRTTMRFIERYLQTGMRVADIGAGTGRYALALARHLAVQAAIRAEDFAAAGMQAPDSVADVLNMLIAQKAA